MTRSGKEGQVCASLIAWWVLSTVGAMGFCVCEVQLKGFEVARAIRLVAEPFTLENDLLTRTYTPKYFRAAFPSIVCVCLFACCLRVPSHLQVEAQHRKAAFPGVD